MKKQMIRVIFLLAILMAVLICKVQAHNVEIDPKSYIYMPSGIYNGEGTISISSAVENEATLYYQKVDISNADYTKLQNKNKESQDYADSEKTKLTTEKANLTSLENTYRTIANDENATEEQRKTAQDAYQNAIKAYNANVEIYNAKINEFNKAIDDLIPNYQENNWTKADGTSNNVKLDFSNYSGQIHFVLWAKLVTSTATYYDVQCYSTNITNVTSISLDRTTATIEVSNILKLNATTNSDKTITWTSSKKEVATVDANGNVKAIAEGITVITATVDGKSANCTITVTKGNTTNNNGNSENNGDSESDFSNAKFSYSSKNLRNLEITINDYKIKENRHYYMYISKNNNENITKIPDDATEIITDAKGIGSARFYNDNANKILEYAGTNYIYIIEKNIETNTQTVVLAAKEMPNVALPNLGLRLDIFLYDPNKTIVANTVQMNEDRKITYKIGKITSMDILKSFKNDSSTIAYAKLLDYAKSTNYMETGTITTNGLNTNLVNKLNIEKGSYYFIYMVADNQNGKYIDIEDIAIYEEANQKEGNTIVHFDFAEMKLQESGEKDTTTATGTIPQTGVSYVAIIVSVIIAFGGVTAYTKYKKYRDIK